MNTSSRQRSIIIALAIVSIGTFAAWMTWRASIIEHVSLAQGRQQLTIDCDFERFRQILVRKNATAAIVGHSGMKVVDERIQDVELDTTGDKRPLLNMLRGQSKSEVSAVKLITVELNDSSLAARELVLRQVADIQEDRIQVSSQSARPAGRLEHYRTTLIAQPHAQGTQVDLSVDMSVRVRVPKLFVGRADAKVQQAADAALRDQAEALQRFITDHADQRLILPEL